MHNKVVNHRSLRSLDSLTAAGYLNVMQAHRVKIFMNSKIYNFCIFIFAGSSFYLAYVGKPAELAGFVVAGALSLVFLKLDSFKEFSGGGFSAKLKERVENLERDIAPIKSKQTDPESEASSLPEHFFLGEESEKVLFSLTNGKYSWRTLGGLKADTKLAEKKLVSILKKLELDGLAYASKSSSGNEIWGATEKGYAVESLHYPRAERENA
jgi:hypothetical protein